MYKIFKKEELAANIFSFKVYAPDIVNSAQPGQFIVVIVDKYSERIPLTICDLDYKNKTIQLVVQVMGYSTKKICSLQEGDSFKDLIGPLGKKSEFLDKDINVLKNKKYVFIAGGVGTAPIYPQVKWFFDNGIDVDVIIGAKSKSFVILEDEFRKISKNVYIATDDGSYGFKGNVTNLLEYLIKNENKIYDECITIGPMIMMKFVCLTTKKYSIPTTVSLNPVMVDATGMCGACRVRVGDNVKFACIEGPEFDGHLVDFDLIIKRLSEYDNNIKNKKNHECTFDKEIKIKRNKDLNKKFDDLSKKETIIEKSKDRFKRTECKEQDPNIRNKNFEEVSYGYTSQEAVIEANRCLTCKKPLCVQGCPVNIDIPGFISQIALGNFKGSRDVLAKYTALPAVCGRVCPQESQCEKVCILTKRGDAVSIGKLERFSADYCRENNIVEEIDVEFNGSKVAIIGSGPSGLACANELAKIGYGVTIFEALQNPGGVLIYGIPEFRLPDDIVAFEINNLKKLNVEIKTNVIIGNTFTIDDLFKQGYKAIFIGSGAGLPKFMNIPGEHLKGVYSANEFLTRANLMRAFEDNYDTPINVGERTAVIGGGNVAMDAARVAKRLNSDVTIIYRRTEAELPARQEEVHHAKEEGIKFQMLTTPIEIKEKDGWVDSIVCIKNELGEPDESGRRKPVEIENSEYEEKFDTIIMALGTTPNPLIASTTPNLDINKKGGIITTDSVNTSCEGIFAGGDAVTGAATVILAMGAGKKAAYNIDEYIKLKNKVNLIK